MMDSRNTDINEEKVQELSKMAYRRKKVDDVDVERELAAFWASRASQSEAFVRPERRFRVRHIWISALLGAAAMFVGFFFFLRFSVEDVNVVAMNFDERPQCVLFHAGNNLVDISSMDSLNLCRNTPVSSRLLASSEISDTVVRHTLSTPRGMDFKITLQDGTEVWLDAESAIEFPSSFAGGERRVNLSGEAYFRVAHNEQKPFVVNVAGKEIKVLGTEFNVRSYATEETQVALVTGSIELCDADKENGECVLLQPGQGAVWSDGNEVDVREVDTYSVAQWIDGLFYFDEQPLAYILRELGRWYNVGVQFHGNAHLGYKIHFCTSRTNSLEEVINDLNLLCPFDIVIEGKNVIVS